MSLIPLHGQVEIKTIDDIHDLIADDMNSVNRLIHESLYSEVALINQLGHYIVNSGGKRLRPILALLSARVHGYHGTDHLNIAAIIEFIHTATLLHDDVVDDSAMRRGRKTANEIWGNEASVLVGDFLYSRSFQMMVSMKNMQVMSVLANTTNTIAEGEVMQLINCNDPETTEQRYLETIRHKTAKLFEAATRLGAVVSDSNKKREEDAARYGRHLGTAFQLIDDVLDYSSDVDELGKNVGDDLAEGKPTLPLLYAMWNGTSSQSKLIKKAIETGGRDQIEKVMSAIEDTGALAYTTDCARLESEKAIESLKDLPPSPYKAALTTLAEFAVDRNS
ncbi:MAG: octaprenyl diphosphate synthase [Gammaproteobacteria bacterium]